MKKNRRDKKANQAARVPGQRTLWLAGVVRENLYDFVIREGMKALDVMLEQDRERLCGPAHAKGAAGDAVRWGATEGRMVMAGQRVVIPRPRVRKAGKEVSLPTWDQFSDEDPLDERTMEQMVLGVSARNYARSVERLPDELGAHGASKSAASRRFVEMTEEKLQQWLSRDISTMKIVAVMIDGIQVADHLIVVALGIDENGEKTSPRAMARRHRERHRVRGPAQRPGQAWPGLSAGVSLRDRRRQSAAQDHPRRLRQAVTGTALSGAQTAQRPRSPSKATAREREQGDA